MAELARKPDFPIPPNVDPMRVVDFDFFADRRYGAPARPHDALITLRKEIGAGNQVGLLVLGEGFGSRRTAKDGPAWTLAAHKTLTGAMTDVVDKAGVAVLYYHQFRDNRFDSYDLLDLVKVIERVLGRHRPRAVYTHHPGDLNIDHRRTFEAVVTATRPMADQTLQALFSIEVPSSTDWGAALGGDAFRPNWFVDVSETLETKLALAGLYKTEVRDDPHPRSIAGLRERARQWGRLSGLPAAEAFVLQRYVEGRQEGHVPH